jgi:hypothetical protein
MSVFSDVFDDTFGGEAAPSQPVIIPTFDAGYAPGPGDFDDWIQGPFAFLTTRVVFRATLNSHAANLPAGDATLIPFDTVLEDPFEGWNASESVWTCPADMSGTYLVSLTGAAQGATNTGTTMRPLVAVNGTPGPVVGIGWAPSNQIGLISGSVPVQLFGGQDSVSGYLYWAGPGNGQMNTGSGKNCTIEISWYSL